MKNKIRCILLILALVSCKLNDQDAYFKDVGKLIVDIDDKIKVDSIKYIVVIPNAGCEGCINEAESLMIKYASKQNESIYFVLTTYDSEKAIYLKYGYEIKEAKNVLIDAESIFNGNGYNSIYPIILYLNKGKLDKIFFQSPKSPDAIINLEALIESI